MRQGYGGPEGARTLDLLRARQALFQTELQALVTPFFKVSYGDGGDRTPDLTDVNRAL